MPRRFEIVEPLGVGGMAVVYRARLIGPGGFRKEVALKLPNGDTGVDLLRDEARALAALRHRAIVGVDGLARLDGRWALVMEYVEGIGLDAITAAQTVPIRTALAIIGEVAGALHVAQHSVGPNGERIALTHRDIKPANILITAGGDVKVLDFGLAMTSLSGHGLPLVHKNAGSVPYVAPERLQGVDGPEGDVYALGAVLYELLVGEPFGASGPDRKHHQSKVTGALLQLGRSEAGQASGVASLVVEMTAFDPTARPSAREVERQCHAWCDRLVGIGLRDFAEVTVPDLIDAQRRAASERSHVLAPGTILSEDAPAPPDPLEGAWTPSTPSSGGSMEIAVTPAPQLSTLDRLRALLAESEPDTFRGAKARSSQPDTSAIDHHWTDDPGPFRALAFFAAIGLLVATGLAFFVCFAGGGAS